MDSCRCIFKKAYKTAHNFAVEAGFDLPEVLIDKLLLDLNRIWKDRERRQIAKIRDKLNDEIVALKRKANNKIPYEAVVANKQITRLKNDLKTAFKELRENIYEKEKKKM